ncbi:MAG: M67 family metallopeptidase [Acidobacteria bacterium]|nr:M67 family metallopeptidase [Acidobacteriota bacterium]
MRIRRAVLEVIREHARRDSPYECCGLLIGTSGEVLEAVETTNVAADPFRRYEVPPVEHLAQIRRCRAAVAQGAAGLAVVGVYHSHPRSSPEPSPTDWEQAFEQFLYVIAGPVETETAMEIRGYRLTAGRFARTELIES